MKNEITDHHLTSGSSGKMEQLQRSSVFRISVDELEVSLPNNDDGRPLTESALKELLWETHKETVFDAMTIHSTGEKSELKKAKQRLLLLDQISEVQRQFLQKKEPRAVFGYLLSGLLDLMDSEYGFIGQIKYEDDGTMYLQTHAITNIAWNQATREFYRENAEAGLKFYNLDSLFGHVMVHAEPLIANLPSQDPRSCGIPDGHPPLNHFLGIPFFESGGVTMNGMVGIANKPGGYSQEDVQFLEPFTVTCSNLIQAYGAMEENVRLIDTLEEKVKERTLALEMANARLESANRQVVEASAAQLKNFACMSHEIRTPLNCVVGLSSLLLETDLTPQQSDSMRLIVNSGELLSAIVNDVLDFSKLISGNVDIDVQPTDVQDTLDAVVYSIEVKANDLNLTLRTDYDPFVPNIIDTDGRRLQQILYNLLGNAIKFSKSKGVVEFSLKVVDPHEDADVPVTERVPMPTHESAVQDESSAPEVSPERRCPFHRPQNRKLRDGKALNAIHGFENGSIVKRKVLRFVVKDYGKGIDRADFSKIFKPFMQASGETENLYGGTGLGLAITSKLVEAMGGTISVDSVLGEWSEFTVDLPFSRKAADVAALSASISDTRIMIVNKDKTMGLPSTLVDTYKLNVTEYESCSELLILGRVKGAIDRNRKYICLIHEDLYDSKDLSVFAEAAPGTVVFTFGPNFCVKDKCSNGHHRSLVHLLPSAFVGSLLNGSSLSSGAVSVEDNASKSIANVDKCASLKVLIAEDNAINQKVLLNVLKRLDITNVVVVDNGQKAVDATNKEKFDFVLMDMQMPIMDGIDATRLILQQDNGRPPPKIVFVTANAMGSVERQVREVGGSGFIPKPFNLKKIESFLASFWAGEEYFTAG
ncbi:hypothetical protein ACA910_019989 [Epithemia clementina (nom. ined.)]